MDIGLLRSPIEDWIGAIGIGIDAVGVMIIVAGVVWSSVRFVFERMEGNHYENYKMRIGRSLLLGLEMLVAADIVKTIALTPTFESLGVLAALVAIRTFLSWSLVVEINGSWPWQPKRHSSEGTKP